MTLTESNIKQLADIDAQLAIERGERDRLLLVTPKDYAKQVEVMTRINKLIMARWPLIRLL